MCQVELKKITAVFILIILTILETRCYAYRRSDEIFYLNDMLNISINTYKDSQSKKIAIISTEGCKIPQIDWSPHLLWDLYRNPEFLKPCQNIPYPLLKNNDTHIWVLDENLRHHFIKKVVSFECCYQPTQYLINSRDKYTKYRCEFFQRSIKAHDEYVRVTCRYNLKVIYEQFFAFVIKKPFTKQRENSFNDFENESAYNVIILGLSSISRANFHRTMRQTSKFLKDRKMVELFGYNRVAESTFLNLMPVLTGMDVKQLKKTCWPNGRTTLDFCSFIWERFKDEGYYSAFLEDSLKYGIFKNNNFGFANAPTDYFLRPSFNETMGKNNMCLGNEFIYRVNINHLEKIIQATASSKLFAIFWESSISHEHLNLPMVMDDTYAVFLRNLENSGYLNKSILIMLSDGGIKIPHDKVLKKKFGLEANLPLASILLPSSFRSKYSAAFDNLIMNSQRLTTPFDMHATLVDLINLHAIRNQEIAARISMDYFNRRGISLFLPISTNRSCEQAYIKKKWCACKPKKKSVKEEKRKRKSHRKL